MKFLSLLGNVNRHKRVSKRNLGFSNRTQPFQNYPPPKLNDTEENKLLTYPQPENKHWQPTNNVRNTTYEQKRALGLCYKCNEKYFPGHQCAVKPLNMVFPADTEGDNSEQLDGTLEKHVEV
jgi:hypothetical protein